MTIASTHRSCSAPVMPANPWREGAIWLYTDGESGGSHVLAVYRKGQWVEVIRDYSTHISHIVEIAGINEVLARAFRKPGEKRRDGTL
jgi:hypothetical protein